MNHISTIFLLPLLTAILLFTGSSTLIGQDISAETEEIDTDSVIVTHDRALFVFQVPEKEEWHWFRDETPDGSGEYIWSASFALQNDRYSCGFNLFKPPFKSPESGSFEQLVDAGQVSVFARTVTNSRAMGDGRSSVSVGSRLLGDISVETAVEPGKLILILEDRDLVDQLRNVRPETMMLIKNTGQIEQNNVTVSYVEDTGRN